MEINSVLSWGICGRRGGYETVAHLLGVFIWHRFPQPHLHPNMYNQRALNLQPLEAQGPVNLDRKTSQLSAHSHLAEIEQLL